MGCCSPLDVRKLSVCAIVFLVVLRLSIGWQFLYEGLWKQHASHGTEPWTAAGYLKNAKGPFRDTFRNMVDDPYDFDKLDMAKVQAHWQKWQQLFDAHYRLDASQKAAFAKLLEKQSAALKDVFESPEITHKTLGDINVYKLAVATYEAKLKAAKTNFQQEHLEKTWLEIESQRKKLTTPIDELTDELQSGAVKLLNLDQIRRGPSPQPASKIASINYKTMWTLTILGFLLVVGLFTRTAAIGAAVMLTMFYLAMPPWPGVPEAPGPEHSFIVNKNFIEIMACLALACMPSGRWLGLDALIHRFILRGKTD